MNHVYSKVWNRTLGAWVVASELSSRRGKPAGRGAGIVAITILAAAIAPALAQSVVVPERDTTDDFDDAVRVAEGPGQAPIRIEAGRVSTTGRFADGIFADSNLAAISIDSDRVTTSGEGTNGVVALSYGGDISIRSGTVALSHAGPVPADDAVHGMINGYYGGIWASSVHGTVAVTSGSAIAHADFTYGIGAQTGFGVGDASGGVRVSSDHVETSGLAGIGIYAHTTGTGAVTVDSGSIATTGDGGHGIWSQSLRGAVTVDSGSVTTAGHRAFGISAQGEGAIRVTSDAVATEGGLSTGIQTFSNASSIAIGSGTVRTEGDSAAGITASSNAGDVSVSSASIITLGEGAIGLRARAAGHAVGVDSGQVSTQGTAASGIQVEDSHTVVIASDSVSTSGDFADGIRVSGVADGGSVDIDSGSITTAGRFADGISVATGSADIGIDSDSIATSGEGAIGIVALSASGDITVRSGTVEQSYEGAFPADNAEHGHLFGVAGAGIWASSDRGANVRVTSGSVTTVADSAYGIGVETGWGDPTATGNATLESGHIQTQGDYAIGAFVFARGSAGDVSVTSGNVETDGLNSHAIYAISNGGGVEVASETVTTSGRNSHGILARGRNGVDVVSGSINIHGGSHTYDDGGVAHSFGIVADGGQGTVSINSGSITTRAVNSAGIVVRSGSAASIDSDAIATEGDLATGIQVAGIAEGGSVDIDSGSITIGGLADGIYVASAAGDVDVHSDRISGANIGIRVTGAADVTIDSGTIDAVYAGISVEADEATINIGAGHTVSGLFGLRSQAAQTTINILGEVVGVERAIWSEGGNTTINNHSNTIVGSLALGGAGNLLNNTGTWIATGQSDFGTGDARIVNTGLIAAPSAGTTGLYNLGTLVNAGTLDLANGQTGDRFEMPGAVFIGQAGSTVRVDVDFASGASDTLALGTIQGNTVVTLNNVASAPGFNLAGLSIIESDAALTGSEFSLATGLEDTGLVGYNLVFDPSSNRYLLQALPGTAAFELVKAGMAAQDFWNKSGEAWATRMVAARDTFAAGTAAEGSGVWIKAHGGGLDFDNSGVFDLGSGEVERDLSTESSWRGLQAGYDRVWRQGEGHALLGLTAGYTDYTLDVTGSGGRFDLDGSNVGVYGAWSQGAFFVQGLAKFDRFSGDVRSSDAAAGGRIKGRSHGVMLDAGLRFGETVWVEPLVGASWSRASIDDIGDGTVGASFDDATSLRSRLGVRVGGSVTGSNATWVPSVGVYAVDERRGRNASTLHLGSERYRAVDTPPGDYARVEAGVTVATAAGMDAFFQAGKDFGSGTDGFNANAGLRWRW